MSKRKSASSDGPPPSLSSLDAALDLLACDTFTRLQHLATKFEAAAGVKLNEGVMKSRWEEAVNRYWVMKSMDDLTCGMARSGKDQGNRVSAGSTHTPNGDATMNDMNDNHRYDDQANGDKYDRPLPSSHHPGAISSFNLDSDEADQWRRWKPKVNDIVIVELPKDGGVWPGKIIDKRVFFQARSVPRGNHFFPVRLYTDDIDPTVTVKSRLIPFKLRPNPPLFASEALQSAYHHANNPTSFDAVAAHREMSQAYQRSHPGVGDKEAEIKHKLQKEQWKKFVNWLMDERRVEKLRAVNEERERRLKAVAKSSASEIEDVGSGSTSARDTERDSCGDEGCGANPRKRRVTPSTAAFSYTLTKKGGVTTVQKVEGDSNDRGGIFRVMPVTTCSSAPKPATPNRHPSGQGASTEIANPSPTHNAMSPFARTILGGVNHRSGSPRRSDRRRSTSTVQGTPGDFSPRRGGTYTPPRVLPSGDETAHFNTMALAGGWNSGDITQQNGTANGSPSAAPSLKNFEFTSKLNTVGTALAAVQELEDEGSSWTTVVKRRTKRAGSAPVEKKSDGLDGMATPNGASDDMAL